MARQKSGIELIAVPWFSNWISLLPGSFKVENDTSRKLSQIDFWEGTWNCGLEIMFLNLLRDKEPQDDVKKKAKGKEIVNRKMAMRRLRPCY